MKIKACSIFLMTVGVIYNLIAQTPQFELITPDGVPNISADFIQGGVYNNILEDLDSDGDLDFVQFGAIEGQLNKTIVSFNDGLGNFTPVPNHSIQDYMHVLGEYAFADLNNDDIVDLIYARLGIDGTKVALGDGTGMFNEKTDVTNLTTAQYGRIFPIDINLDDNIDLLIAGYSLSGGYTGIYINDGNANFDEVDSANFAMAGSTVTIAASRPYSGGQIDIVLAGGSGSWIYHYDGVGNYTLTSTTAIEADNAFSVLEFGDVNGDGIDDLFVLGRNTPSAERVPSIYINDGTGNYTLDTSNLIYTTYDNNTDSKFVFFGDLTGNGVADIGVSVPLGDLNIYINNGDGSFASPAVIESDYEVKSYTLGDIDGDDDLDLIENITPYDFLDPGDENALTTLYLNDGDGNFNKLSYDYLGDIGNAVLVVMDANNDGLNEIILNGHTNSEDDSIALFLNDSLLQFTGSQVFNSVGVLNGSSLVTDYNRDGLDDIIMVGNRTIVANNLGDGTFNPINTPPFESVGSGDIVQLDIDSDNDLDILISGSGKTLVYRNYGKSDYREETIDIPGFNNVSMDVADVSGDGIKDLVISGELTGEASTKLYFGDGVGGFNEQANDLPDLTYGDAKFFDIDGDNDFDLVIAGGEYSDTFYQEVYQNDGTGQFTLIQTLDGLANASIQEMDIDLDGDLDFISTGLSDNLRISSTTLYLNDGDGLFTKSGIALRDMQDARIAFEDLDNDYDKDLVLVGEEGINGTYHSRVYHNKGIYPVINEEKTTCSSYYFYGNELTSSGLYSHSITTTEGDSRQINLDLTVFSPDIVNLNIDKKGPYEFNGELIFESGIYETYFVNAQGCDSIVTINLSVSDFLEPKDYDHIAYELVLPDAVPQFQTDFMEAKYGESVIYDADGDGDNDYFMLAESTAALREFAVSYINQGNGKFSRVLHKHISYDKPQGSPILLHGDVSGDGIEDLIISGEQYKGVAATDYDTKLYLGDSDGGLTEYDAIDFPSALYGYIDIVDLSGDDQLDILVGHFSDGAILYVSDGMDGFSSNTISELSPNIWASDIAISDPYNGGMRDILVGTLDDSFVPVYRLVRYDGTDYTIIAEDIFSARNGSKAQFGDANADGVPDLFITHLEITELYLNDGTGTYTLDPEEFDGISSEGSRGLFVDLNNDNAWEILINESKPENDSLYIFWNDGTGNFNKGEPRVLPKSSAGYHFVTGDLSGDNFPDLFHVGEYDSSAWKFTSLINDQSNGFNEVSYNLVTNVKDGTSKFEDFNEDGHPDLIVTGEGFEKGIITELYLNDGTGYFEPIPSHDIDSLTDSNVAFADIDNNNTMDLVVCGETSSGDVVTKLYTNSAGVFTHNSSVAIVGVKKASLTFFNANQDAHPDLLVIGEDQTGSLTAALYLNDGSGGFSSTASGINGLKDCVVSIGKINDDDLLDILVTGHNDINEWETHMYYANGDGTYEEESTSDLIEGQTNALIDINGDGYNDIYLAGNGEHRSYINDGKGNYSLNQIMNDVWSCTSVFDDVDLDGDIDFIVSGNWYEVSKEPGTYIYVNDGNGNFTESSNTLFHNANGASIDVIDIDGDLDKDVVISGGIATNTEVSRIYKNITVLEDVVIWQDAAWSNVTGPTASDRVLIADEYATDANGTFVMESLKIYEENTLTIGAGTTLDVTGNVDNKGNMVVESGGSLLTYEANTVSGNPVTFKRNTRYADNKYSMLGSPVESDASIIGSDLGPTVYAYDETIAFNDGTEDGINRWLNASSDVLQPGVGYAAAGQQEITFEGFPNDGDVSFIGLSRTEDASTTADNWGWHLVSNPYPAAIDLNEFISGNPNIQGTIALWDDHGSGTERGTNADYLIANAIGSVTGPNGGQFEGYIGSMQGFFIQVGDGQSGNLSFTESMRVNGNNGDGTFFRQTESKIPKIKLAISTDDGKYSETLIGFSSAATSGFDRLYDAVKLKSQKDFNIYTIVEEKHIAIQGLPLVEEDIDIPLGFDLDLEGEIELSMIEFEGFDKGYEVYLRNNLNGTLTRLAKRESVNLLGGMLGVQTNYSLVVSQAQITNIETELSPLEFFAYDDGIQLNLVCDQCTYMGDIQMVNLSGKVVYRKQNVKFYNGKYSLSKPDAIGLYIIQMTSEDSSGYAKVIIR